MLNGRLHAVCLSQYKSVYPWLAGRRVVPVAEYAQWVVKHNAAKTALQGREARLEEVAELIETDLTLLGATAIEDKLQLVHSPSQNSHTLTSTNQARPHLAVETVFLFFAGGARIFDRTLAPE